MLCRPDPKYKESLHLKQKEAWPDVQRFFFVQAQAPLCGRVLECLLPMIHHIWHTLGPQPHMTPRPSMEAG